MRLCIFIALLFVGVSLGNAQKVHAQEKRFALVIGANRGQASDGRLRFAVSDARKVGRVLSRYGNFPEENVVTLENPTAKRVRRALKNLGKRIRFEAANRSSLLTVFYSGHADALSLHLSGTSLPWDELQKLVKETPADLRLLILDACRSGSATRVKGAKLAKPFLPSRNKQTPQGLAILSSATAGEDAQESDELGASFFTHHLVSALRGVADKNRDGSVTLAEAYKYTADRTIASTASTLAGIQHPTYKYDLKGKSDIVLTRTRKRSKQAAVLLSSPGQYIFHEKTAEGSVIAEGNVEGSSGSREIWLPPGRYFVRIRQPRKLYEGPITVRASSSNPIRFEELRPVAYAQLARKGPTPRGAFSLSGWGGYSLPMLGYTGMPVGAMIFSWDASAITLDGELRFAYGWNRDEVIDAELFETDLLIGARKVFDVGPFAFSLGIRAGAGIVVQRFDTERVAPTKRRWIPLVATILRAEYQLPAGWFVGTEARLGVTHLKSTDGLGNESTETPVRFAGTAGLGRYW